MNIHNNELKTLLKYTESETHNTLISLRIMDKEIFNTFILKKGTLSPQFIWVPFSYFVSSSKVILLLQLIWDITIFMYTDFKGCKQPRISLKTMPDYALPNVTRASGKYSTHAFMSLHGPSFVYWGTRLW